jgi:(p)ppGpp synthase/HD superfamily hydrolase
MKTDTISKINNMPYRNENLMRLAAFAADAHAGQRRKYVNEPYIEHPVRVMYTCMNRDMPLPILYAALLHDVLEDTKVTEDELLAFLRKFLGHMEATEVLSLVLQLTDVYTPDRYPHWNRRIRKAAELERLKTISAEAQGIKYADILDNAAAIITEDQNFAEVLLKEYHEQLTELVEGDPILRQQAMSKITMLLSSLGKVS